MYAYLSIYTWMYIYIYIYSCMSTCIYMSACLTMCRQPGRPLRCTRCRGCRNESQKWHFMKDGEDPSPTAAGHIYRMAEEALHRLQVQGPTEVGSQQPTLAADRQSRPALCARNCAGQQESVTARIRPADTDQGLHCCA